MLEFKINNIKEILHYDFKLNLTLTDWLKGIAFILAPNVVFWIFCYIGGVARPIINEDYLWVTALWVFPYRWAKFLAGMAWVILLIFDTLMIIMQWFPFMDLTVARYLLPFITTAPTRYIVLILILFGYILLFPYSQTRFSRKVKKLTVWVPSLLWAVIAYFIGYVTYNDVPPERFGRDHYYVSASQYQLYKEQTGNVFAQLANTPPVLNPYKKDTASEHLNRPYHRKLLLIVNESWGVARKAEVQRAILEKLYALPNTDYIQEGFFDFAGATVQGEMRELCHLSVEHGYSFKELPETHFSQCIPNQLKQQGYQTVAMHGSGSHMYDRYSWYQKAGFNETIFSENLLNAKRCHAFNGVCDSELYQQVSKAFQKAEAANKPIMFYWLTLTSHVPYQSSDITNQRFHCQKYQIPEGDICNNMRMQAQFFDGLAELLKQPEMKGVEVLVVGDHMPPIMQNIPIHHYIHWNDVSWVHLKIKE